MAVVTIENFADLWDWWAARRPGARCQIHGRRRRSWGEVEGRAASVADALRSAGLGAQDKVAQYLYNCPEYLESVWACFKCALVPVNTNYRYTDDELVYLWTNADVAAVVFHGVFVETIERIRGRTGPVRLWLWVDDGTGACPAWAVPYESVASSTADARAWARSGDDLLLLYTGGTTGLPKGVMWRQADMLGVLVGPLDLEAMAADPDGRPVHLPASPLMHGVGLNSSTRAMSVGGAVLTLVGRSFDAVELLDTIERERATSLAIVGDAFAMPIADALDDEPNRWDMSSLRGIASSGVMFSASTKSRLLGHMPTLSLVDSLGSSEALGVASSVTTKHDIAATARFHTTANARVIDDEGSDVVAGTGQVGVLAVRGHMPLGYYKDPEKTARTFRVLGGVRWSIPGDFATVELDGSVTLLGRGSVCINTGGEKVYPEEVEEALKSHPAVRDAIVVGLPHERFGEAVQAVVETAAPVDPDELIAHVKTRLARYKAPKRVFIAPSLRRAANGKADYVYWKNYALDRAHDENG